MREPVRRRALWAIAVASVVVVAIQFVPIDRTNPPVQTEIPASPAVLSVLRRGCYDCHSNETSWPWYSRVAPVSWLLAYDVREGRAAVNYSNWNALDPKQQFDAIGESWEEVQHREMPPWYYLLLHWNAHLSAEDRAVLREWSVSSRPP